MYELGYAQKAGPLLACSARSCRCLIVRSHKILFWSTPVLIAGRAALVLLCPANAIWAPYFFFPRRALRARGEKLSNWTCVLKTELLCLSATFSSKDCVVPWSYYRSQCEVLFACVGLRLFSDRAVDRGWGIRFHQELFWQSSCSLNHVRTCWCFSCADKFAVCQIYSLMLREHKILLRRFSVCVLTILPTTSRRWSFRIWNITSADTNRHTNTKASTKSLLKNASAAVALFSLCIRAILPLADGLRCYTNNDNDETMLPTDVLQPVDCAERQLCGAIFLHVRLRPANIMWCRAWYYSLSVVPYFACTDAAGQFFVLQSRKVYAI